MGRLITLDVLIVGMRGVGIECAKNLCLAGPRSVTVCDPNKVFMRDLGRTSLTLNILVDHVVNVSPLS